MGVTLETIQGWFTPPPVLCRGRKELAELWGTAPLTAEGGEGLAGVGLASRLPVGISGRTLLLVEDVRREAGTCDVLWFPAGQDPAEIRERVEQGLARRFRQADRERRILRAGLDGGLDVLVQTGAEVLGRPILLGDPILTVLAHSGQPHEESWEGFIQSGYAPDFQADATPFAQNSFPLDEQFVACRIYNRRMDWTDLLIDLELNPGTAAHLVISGKGGPFQPEEYGPLAALCHGICGELRRQTDPALQRMTGEQFVGQLLHGTLRGELLDLRAGLLGQAVEGSFSIAVIELKGYHPLRSSISTIRRELESAAGPSALEDGRLMLLLTRPNARPAVERVLRENGLRGGLSRVFPHLEEAPRFRRQAERVLEVMSCLEDAGELVDYGTAEQAVLFRSLPREVLEELVRHPLALRLAELDQGSKFSFTDTLTVYLECAQRPALACQRLHIHRNTLDYRLRRLEELAEIHWEQGGELAVLYLALMGKRYCERESGQRG